MKKRVCLLTGSEQTKRTLENQLQEHLGAEVEIISAAQDSGIPEIPEVDVIVISSKELWEELVDNWPPRLQNTPCIVCARTLNLERIEQLIRIPKGTEVLFVNDLDKSSKDCIANLLEVELDHLRYVPWSEEKPGPVTQDYALTAGETQLVPKGIEHVIDLGPRIIDVITLLKIREALGIGDDNGKNIIRPYVSKIIDISKKMAIINAETEVLKHILREKLEAKGHVANYTFDHIVGVSEEIKETKARAAKLAKTDLTVLIEGESGSGKELFAAAIHNRSLRKNGPYLAVNFSALPEELLESELFGYEEGAFTGAKKGGKIGLFEQADGGTLFLDEIGDITPRMQSRLLRVIQEKEVMPVGSGTIKQVDVRVISATNKNLRKMVEQGQFRADLYYRLKMGYLYILPLRERKEDIAPLVRHFIETQSESTVTVADEVLQIFQNQSWQGNVREISNTVQYMLAVRQQPNHLETTDLPDDNYFGAREITVRPGAEPTAVMAGGETVNVEPELEEDLWEVLEAVWQLRKKYGLAGRDKIARYLLEHGCCLTVGQIRGRLAQLETQGYVICQKGKKGTVLTQKGKELLKVRNFQ